MQGTPRGVAWSEAGPRGARSVSHAEDSADALRRVFGRGRARVREHDQVVAAGEVTVYDRVDPRRAARHTDAGRWCVRDAPLAQRLHEAHQVVRRAVSTAGGAAAAGQRRDVAFGRGRAAGYVANRGVLR